MNIYLDECGYTGQHLLNTEQCLFVLASTSLTTEESSDLLRRFSGRIQGECKYTKLKKARRNMPLIYDLLRDARVTSSSCKIYAIHKPFMVATKMVDNIYEPLMREDNLDFYEGKKALATANLLNYILPASIGRTRYMRFLCYYSDTCRKKDQESFDRFSRETEKIYCYLERKHSSTAIMFAAVVEASRRGLGFISSHVTDTDHDPVIPSYHMLAIEWSKQLKERFTVTADASKILAAERENLLRYSDPARCEKAVQYYGHSVEYPLKVDDIVCACSDVDQSIQMADFLAGVTYQAFNSKAMGNDSSTEEKGLADLLSQKELITGCLWPTSDVTPESLNATGLYHGNPVDKTVDFLT